MRTTVRLPQDLLDDARRKAAVEKRTLTALIEDGLRLVVRQNRKGPKSKRTLPRISTAASGLLPGIDLDDSAALEEADDLDRLRRAG